MEKLIEQIHYEGGIENLRKVFSEIFLFAKEGKRSEKRPVLLVLGGAQRGAYSGGGVIALEKAGLRNGFHSVIGVSTGAPVVSYFISGQSEIGTSIYFEENTGDEFINLRQLKTDISWLCSLFRGEIGKKKLDINKLKKSNTDIFYVATRVEDGKSIFLDAKKIADPVEGIRASAAIPFLYKDEVVIDGKKYVDGDVAGSFPVSQIINTIRPTSLLVFANRPKNVTEGLMFKLFRKFASLNQNEKFSEAFRNQDKEFEKELEILKNSGIPYTIIWTDNLLNSLEKNPKKIRIAARKFERYVATLIKNLSKV